MTDGAILVSRDGKINYKIEDETIRDATEVDPDNLDQIAIIMPIKASSAFGQNTKV